MATKKTAAKAAPKKTAARKTTRKPAAPKIEDTPAGLIPPEQAPDGKPADVEVAALTAQTGDSAAVLHLDGKKYRLKGEIVGALRRAFETAHNIVNPGH